MRAAGQLLLGVLGSLLYHLAAGATPHPGSDNWIGTWGYVCPPPPPGVPITVAGLPAPIDNPGNVPIDYTTLDLGSVTVRQVVRVSQGGTKLRLRFSNENNVDAVPMGAVHVGEAGVDGCPAPCRRARPAPCSNMLPASQGISLRPPRYRACA